MITDRTAGGESEGGAEEVSLSLGYKGESMETRGRKWYGEACIWVRGGSGTQSHNECDIDGVEQEGARRRVEQRVKRMALADGTSTKCILRNFMTATMTT